MHLGPVGIGRSAEKLTGCDFAQRAQRSRGQHAVALRLIRQNRAPEAHAAATSSKATVKFHGNCNGVRPKLAVAFRCRCVTRFTRPAAALKCCWGVTAGRAWAGSSARRCRSLLVSWLPPRRLAFFDQRRRLYCGENRGTGKTLRYSLRQDSVRFEFHA